MLGGIIATSPNWFTIPIRLALCGGNDCARLTEGAIYASIDRALSGGRR